MLLHHAANGAARDENLAKQAQIRSKHAEIRTTFFKTREALKTHVVDDFACVLLPCFSMRDGFP